MFMKSTPNLAANGMIFLRKGAIVLLALMICTAASAQSVRVKGGLNLATMRAWETELHTGTSVQYPLKPGFHLGVTVELPLAGFFSLEPGLFFSTKGFERSSEKPVGFITYMNKTDLSFNYLELPLLAKATFKMGSIRFYTDAGPYFGYALSGVYQYEVSTKIEGITEISSSDDGIIKWIADGGDFRRMDFGLMVGAGAEFGSVGIGVNYSRGLMVLQPEHESIFTQKHGVWSITAGYRFN